MNSENDKLVSMLREHWQSESDSLDASTRSKLNRMRQSALEAKPARPFERFMNWLPAAVAASLALAVILLVTRPVNDISEHNPSLVQSTETSGTNDVASSALEDLDLLASDESIDLYADLEFYQWLETELADSGTL